MLSACYTWAPNRTPSRVLFDGAPAGESGVLGGDAAYPRDHGPQSVAARWAQMLQQLQLLEQGFDIEVASVAHYPDHEEALRKAGVRWVFNFYAAAGENFAEHVVEDLGSLIARPAPEVA